VAVSVVNKLFCCLPNKSEGIGRDSGVGGVCFGVAVAISGRGVVAVVVSMDVVVAVVGIVVKVDVVLASWLSVAASGVVSYVGFATNRGVSFIVVALWSYLCSGVRPLVFCAVMKDVAVGDAVDVLSVMS